MVSVIPKQLAMSAPSIRFALRLALCGISLMYFLAPQARGTVLTWSLALLFSVVCTVDLVRSWRSGRLTMTISALHRSSPRTEPLEFLAVALGVVAVIHAL